MRAPEQELVAFGQMLRAAREERGMSQDRFALKTGVHRTGISKFERGETDPRMTSILRLARGLGVPPGALLDPLVAGDTRVAI